MEQERLRQEAIKQAERDRREKYKKQEDEREGIRQNIRDKVRRLNIVPRRIICCCQSMQRLSKKDKVSPSMNFLA